MRKYLIIFITNLTSFHSFVFDWNIWVFFHCIIQCIIHIWFWEKMQIPYVSSDQPSARAVRCWDTSCHGRGRCWRRIGGQLFQSGPFQTFPLQSLNKMSAFQQKCRKHGSNREAQEEDLYLVQKKYLVLLFATNWPKNLIICTGNVFPQLLLIVFPTRRTLLGLHLI